jgi:NAD(P)-dependent dehydrogenase (short-subunit alcohol dehydrogenase family)
VLEDEGGTAAEEIRESGADASFWSLDVTKEEEVRAVFADVRERLGSIDILVNNAGIAGVSKPTHLISEEEWNEVIDVNVKGVFLCTKHAVPVMKSGGGGNIINISSIYGMVGAPDLPPYHASKGAVRLMTKTDALFYAKDNIRVNSVHPGFIWTPLVEELARTSPGGRENFRKGLEELHPLGDVGRPEDIANGVVYLASDESSFMTGSELIIDGGYTCK